MIDNEILTLSSVAGVDFTITVFLVTSLFKSSVYHDCMLGAN